MIYDRSARYLYEHVLLYAWCLLCFVLTVVNSQEHSIEEKQAGLGDCTSIYIGASYIQPQVSGRYVLQSSTHNNRFVYRHECADYALYMDTGSDGGSRWIIGPQPGSQTKHVMTSVHSATSYPRDHQLSWLSWHQASRRFIPDPRIFLSCSDVNQDCSSFVIKGPDVLASLHGPYVRQNVPPSQPTAYRHSENSDIYMVHQDGSSGCPSWILGTSGTDNKIFMQSFTQSHQPFTITDHWFIHHSYNSTQKTYNVRIECIDKAGPLTCGSRIRKKTISALLLGGNDVYPGKWPHMISYRRPDGVHKCGGVLLDSRWVLTAGHCVSRADMAEESIVLGAYNLDITEQNAITYRIKSVHLHPEFVWTEIPFRLDYDIALVELDHEVLFTDYIQPVCIPQQNDHFPFSDTKPSTSQSRENLYTSCHILGWGLTDSIGQVGAILQENRVKLLRNISDCHDDYFALSVGPWMRHSKGICVIGHNSGRMCKGDSGSPLLCQRDGTWVVLGLGGWSHSECTSHLVSYPSVYVDVSIFSDWISAVMHAN